MHKFLYLILFLSCIYVSEAQTEKRVDTMYYRYDASVGSSELSNYYAVKTTNEKGEIAVKEFFRFTVPHGLKATYAELKNGSKEGAYAHYNKDGFVAEEGFFENNEKNGVITFYKNGKIQRKVPYVNGKQDGVASYFVNGKKLYEWTWKNGKSDGYNESYHDNGNLRFKGAYVHGKSEGIATRYYENGTVSSVMNFENGEREGPYRFYHKNGTLFAEGNFKQGKESGIWKWYRDNASLASEELYSNSGRLKKLTFYDADGKEIKARKKDKLTGVLNDKKELHARIQKHMVKAYNFPEILRNNGFEARVFISFKIDKNGDVVDVKSNSDAHPSFDLEAENLIKSFPKQEPTYSHNVLIDASFSIPLVFRILE